MSVIAPLHPPPPRVGGEITDPVLRAQHASWENFSWQNRGDEWSALWGGTDGLWFSTLLPRLRNFLPARHVLEIGPGMGRISTYLRHWCERLTLLDFCQRSLDGCRERFRADSHIDYVYNNGRSLASLKPMSVDLCVSWQALIHADRGTVRAYLSELARVLVPGGAAFIHHSNMGEHAGEATDQSERGRRVREESGARPLDISAQTVAEDARAVGLRCVTQELVQWHNNGLWMDAFSLLVRDEAQPNQPPTLVRRYDWPAEIQLAERITRMYRARATDPAGGVREPEAGQERGS